MAKPLKFPFFLATAIVVIADFQFPSFHTFFIRSGKTLSSATFGGENNFFDGGKKRVKKGGNLSVSCAVSAFNAPSCTWEAAAVEGTEEGNAGEKILARPSFKYTAEDVENIMEKSFFLGLLFLLKNLGT